MLITCSSKSSANIFINNPTTNEREELFEIDLNGFGPPAEAVSSGTNYDGSPCFSDNGSKFNGARLAHCSTYTDISNSKMYYWNYETQSWGG